MFHPSPAAWALLPVSLSVFQLSTVWREKRHLHVRAHVLYLWIMICDPTENSELFVYLPKTRLHIKRFVSGSTLARTESRYRISSHDNPILALSLSISPETNRIKTTKQCRKQVAWFYVFTSSSEHELWVMSHAGPAALHGQSLHFCPCWSRRLLLSRWRPNAPLHSSGDLDAMQPPQERSYEPNMWLSICLRAYLLFCRACWQEWCNCWWLIFGCRTNVDSTWMKSEPWYFEKCGGFAHPPHKLQSSAVTSGKVWKRKPIKMTQHDVNEKHKQK